MNIAEVAKLVGATNIVPPNGKRVEDCPTLKKLAPIQSATPGDLSFIANPDYAKYAASTSAAALLVKQAFPETRAWQIVCQEPYLGFARVGQKFYQPPLPPEGISDHAYVDPTAKIGKNCRVAAFSYISENVSIGDHVAVFPGVVIGAGTVIGNDCTIFPNAVIYHGTRIGNHCIIHGGAVIGADGFGYAVTAKETVKIPQVGVVHLEDDVEVGAGATIDRAAMGMTKIGQGSKIDSQVQVGHNVTTGERCMLSAFTGIAGSTTLGNRVTMGGHSGATGHISIADDSRIGGMTGVVRTIDEPGKEWLGFPAQPAMQWRRMQILMARLSDWEKRLRSLEKKL